jgi:LmbE family N-acetylglucosaminyl deacetylase
MRAVRAQEVRTAVGLLGLGPERLVFLDQPDTAAPVDGPAFEAVVVKLVGLIEADCTAVLAPWRYDPHCDHEAASLVAAEAVARASVRHVAYPVWGWTLPPETPIPEPPMPGFRFDVEPFLPVKRLAIAAHESQYGELITDDPGGFRLPPALLAVFDQEFETFLLP